MNRETISKIMNSDGDGKTVLTAKTAWQWVLEDGRWLYVNKV